jgi:prepilin-type processing-associated H-X9-DG protein
MAAYQSPGRKHSALSPTELLVLLVATFLLVSLFSPLSTRLLRERVARDGQGGSCIWNIHAITAALRMYASDHDFRLPPLEHDETAIQYFDTRPGGSGSLSGDCQRVDQANPYLRWPVVLDSYLRTRSVWSCHQAQLEQGAAFIIGAEDWLSYLMANEGLWGTTTGFCIGITTYPSGWGGSVTDSLRQQTLASRATGAFVQSIGSNAWPNRDRDIRYIPRPDSYVLVADGGATVDMFSTGTLAYPDLCALECGNSVCGWVDWEICAPWAAECGLYNIAPSDGSFLQPVRWQAQLGNTSLRAAYARHHGGVNVGFLDGHVAWVHSESLIDQSSTWSDPTRGTLRGYSNWGPTSDCEFTDLYPGVPTLY